ncbi:MAG TPA: FecR family protein [Pyrinomonadaceae bacterium]
MNQLKRASLLSLMALAFVCAGVVGAARADVRDLRVVSARAGGVNLVAGDVKVRRVASADWLALSTADELKSGDTVRTGSNGRVEVLLNPGSYFRAGGNTEFTLASADLNDLRVELDRGSAVVEATGYGDMDLSIEVAVPNGVVKIVRGGVYRINAPAGAPSEVAVEKGRAFVGVTMVKGGKVARMSGGTVEVAKFDKNLRDELDQWSRERGKELAKANDRLSRRALQSAFRMGSFDNIYGAQRSFNGYWFFNYDLRCYTFLPYGWGWRSPYGYGYNTGVYWPRPDPSAGWTPRNDPSGGGGGGGSTPNPGGGSRWPGGGGSVGGSATGSGGGYTPSTPTHISPPTRAEPMERPMRERTIEPGARP